MNQTVCTAFTIRAKPKTPVGFLRWLQREFGHAPTAAVGYSLGGNMLACLLAKEGNDLPG